MRIYLLYFALLIFGNSFSQNVPVAYDLSVSFYKDSSGIIQLVGSDQDGDDLTYQIYTVCSGTVQYTDDGVFQAPGSTSDHGRLIYKPYKTSEYNYFINGTDTFEYLVSDEDGDSARATVTIKVYDEYLNPPTSIGEIDGEAEGDNFGHAISFSENGNIMAVGAPNNDTDVADSEKGSVRVFQYSGSGTDWQQIGNDIDGSNNGDEFGSSVSLSGDGKILAVGIPENDLLADSSTKTNVGQVKVYTYDSGANTWNLTATITPNTTDSGINKKVSEQFGHDVRLSLDGKTLAVSDIWFDKNGGNNAGRVMVYKYDGTTWNAISGELELVGESSDNASWGIALSARGDILAVGIHEDDDFGTNAGKVVVYEYNKSSNSWDTKGTLLGSSLNEKFGAAVDINSDGSTIVVGAPHFRENSTRSYLGKVKVFKWDGSAYSILGQELVGSDKYDYLGAQLSIDSQGSTIAVMGPGHDANPGTSGSGDYLKKGRVRVYNYDETSTSWIQTPTSYDFDGEEDGDQSTGQNKESRGQAAVLSADGSILAYGARENDGNGSNSGHVRMYRLFETQIKPTVTSKMVDDFLLYEQQTTDEEITLDGSDPDSGPSDLVYIITQLETAKLFEGDTPITKSDLPYTLTGNKVKYNSNSDTVVNDEFYFIAQDGKASSCPGRIQLTVIPDNDAPVAIAQETLTTDEDVALSITLAGTDVDSPTSDFAYIIGTLPSNGTLKQGDTEINAAETSLTGTDITYTPNSNYSGNDSFTFKIEDKGVDSDGVTDVETSAAANISITVNNTDNDPPVAENKSISAGQDAETSAITLVASDPDSDNSTLVYSIASLPSNGTLKDGGTEITGAADLTGALTYLPNNGYAGSDSFTFTAKDDQSAVSAAATVSISVSDTNDPPIATAKSITVDEDVESETIVLEATDPDATDTTFTFSIASLPSNGTLKDGGTEITAAPHSLTGELTYLSNSNYVGDDSFTFTAKDDESAESTAAIISITVNNTNDPPIADNQSVTTREDTTTNPVITLTATDPDSSDTSFTFTIKSLPTNGVLKDGDTEINTVDTDLSAANLTYTPNLNYNGSDSFNFTAKDDESAISSSATLSLIVSPWNDPPVANSQDLTTDENVDLSITVSGTDVDGDTLTYVLYTLPTNGTLKQGDTTIQASDIPLTISSNDFTYVPNTGFNGADSFKFKVRDLTPDSFATANSMELIKNAGSPVTYETEYGKTYFLIQSTPTKMDWPDAKALTDSYYGARMYVVINADMEKAVYDALQSMNRLDGPFWMGLFQDRNADDYDEPDKGWYWVNGNKLGDGYVNWGEDEPNNSNDIEDYGQFNYGDKGIKWNDMEIGTGQSYALFEFTAEDSAADINITVSEFNDPPVATLQNVSTDEDVELDITLAGTDSESTTLSYIVSELPANGELKDGSETIKSDDLPKTLSSSSVKYIPNNYYNGSDSFKFKVKDTGNADGSNKKESSDATVSITINSINNKPVPTPQTSLKTNEDTPLEITHTGTDPDGDNLDFIIVTLPSNGKLEDSGTEITSGDLPKKLSTEKVTYTPNDNFNGTDSYTFKVNDGSVDSDSAASIELTINNVNDPPVANNQSLKTNEDTELKITLTGSDPENDPLTYIIKSLPTYGKLKEGGNIILQSELPKLLPADSLTYLPDANYIGDDSFDFMINANYLNSFSKANDLKFITQNGQPVTYQKPEGKTYFLIQENTGVSGSPIDWTTAKDLTNSIDGAKMYVILNAEMELLVWNGLKSMGLTGQGGLYYWIGLYQDRNADDYDEPDKGWYWDDGVKLGAPERPYTNWYPGEPNNAGDEDYAQFEFSSNGPDGIKWNDMSIGNSQSWPLFEFSISGSSDSNTATISIEVQEVNDPPIADNIDLSMDEDGEINVTMNATDPEGAIELNYVIKSLPKNGKISENNVELTDSDIPKILSGKTVKYEPIQDFNGTDNFTYNAIDKDCPNTNTSKLEVTGDFTASATGSNPMIIPPQNIKGSQSENQKQVDIKFTVGQGDIFQSCEIKLDVKSFDDGLQFTIDGVNLLSFSQKHWDPSFGANTTEFSGSGRFVTNGNLWQPWVGDGNPKLEIATGKIKLMVDTKNGTREDALPFMDPSADSNWAKVNSFTYDCEAGFNLLIGNHNGGGGAGGIDADLTVEAYIVPCEESNVATVSITVNGINDPPKADDQTVNTDEDLEVDITNVGSDIETDVLNLNYIVTSLPSNGILKDGSKTITASDIPYTLNNSNIATYVPNSDFYGEDKYNFKVNDGEDDSNIATVTIKIKEFILDLPNNYNIVTTETCIGSDFGIIDIEVVASSYKKTPSGPEIPITYNVVIEGKGNVGKITSPAKTLQIIDLPEGTHKLVFTVESELKYEHTENVTIDATDPPAAYPVEKFETCDDDKDNDDANGKVNFDTTTLIDKLLTNPGTGTKQDQNLFEFEFTYFDEATSASITKSTLPNPFYSANQTISVNFKSKINGKCEASQNIDFQVNPLPSIERIEDNKSVCLNLPAITIGVKSSDSRTYTYTWTRDGTDFPPNINGTDSSILVGLGGEYVVTATTTDGTNCSKTMKITLSESETATFIKKDVEIKDLFAGPNNTITILTTTLGIGDYEYALDDQTGPYQDDPVFEKVRPGKHTVFVRDKNGCGTVSMDIWVIGFKKFFTPNGDGYTDFWNIIGITERYQANSKIYIFDRLGKLLKELDPLSPGWNGNFNGKPMPQTDYWFKVILEDGRTFEGHFSLVRGW